MRIRHLAILGTLAAALVAVVATPALADDLSEYLEDADSAAYSGRRLVRTSWDGIETVAFMDVQHADGLTMVGAGPGYTMVGHGKVRVSGTSGVAIEYDTRNALPAPLGYSLTQARMEIRAGSGRPVHIIEVHEGDLLRMRMVVDAATGAPLDTEVYDAAGNLFRSSTMVEFSPKASELADYRDDGEYYMMLPLAEAQLPANVGRYELVDAYTGPGEAEQGFYSDGLFQHSVFTISGRADLDEMAPQGQTWMLGGFAYRRVVTPAEIWVLWNTPDATYALVGDLPPDHLEAVLAELPRPGERNWFARVWERLFG